MSWITDALKTAAIAAIGDSGQRDRPRGSYARAPPAGASCASAHPRAQAAQDDEEEEAMTDELCGVVLFSGGKPPTRRCDLPKGHDDGVHADAGIVIIGQVDANAAREVVRLAMHENTRTAIVEATPWKADADRLADEVAALVERKVIDSRSPAADALLNYRDPPTSPRSDRIAELEKSLDVASRAIASGEQEKAALRAELETERRMRLTLFEERVKLRDYVEELIKSGRAVLEETEG